MKPINPSSSPNLNSPGRREPGIRGFDSHNHGHVIAAPITTITAQKKG